jgi:hypothetical protein
MPLPFFRLGSILSATGVALLLLGLGGDASAADPSPYVALDAKGKRTQPKAGPRPHACVLDTRSGLTWEVKTDDDGLRDKDWLYSWFVGIQPETGKSVGYPNSGRCHKAQGCDTESYAGKVSQSGLCGFRDWRLPTAAELEGLLLRERAGAKIDPVFFPNTPASYFWSSDFVPLEVGGATLVSFELGMSLAGNSGSGAHVRLVRGPTTR